MSHYAPNIDSERLAQLTAEVNRVARLLSQLTTPSNSALLQSNDQEEVSRDSVERIISARRDRTRFLPSELFAEPSWDILLDLLRAELAQQRISVSSLCIAAAVPTSTALRHITNLVEQGLILRRADPFDGRRSYLELSPETSAALRQYFANVIENGVMRQL